MKQARPKKRIGRPPTGRAMELLSVRIPQPLMAALLEKSLKTGKEIAVVVREALAGHLKV